MAKWRCSGNAGQPTQITFRELLGLVEAPAGKKRPSAKDLRTSGEEVLVQADSGNASITVYKNGWAIYSEGRHVTVCNVWHCRKAVEYEFQDGITRRVEYEDFADHPCVIRLALEGEHRLSCNESTRKRLRESAYSNEVPQKRNTDKAPDILSEIIIREGHKEMIKLISESLTVRQEQIFRLHFIDGYSQSEVAEILGCTPANISECVRRIRKRLMEVMDGGITGER